MGLQRAEETVKDYKLNRYRTRNRRLHKDTGIVHLVYRKRNEKDRFLACSGEHTGGAVAWDIPVTCLRCIASEKFQQPPRYIIT